MDKELEFLGKLKKLCEDYHLWIVPDFDSNDVCYFNLSDYDVDSSYVNGMIEFYSSDLPF